MLPWLLVLLTLVPGSAKAHHILGVPHYAYSEEYPQVPFVEVLAQVGSHDLDFTYYPGTPNPGDAVRFKLYVYDRETGEVFHGPLTVEVYETRFLRRAVPVRRAFEIRQGTGPEANDYKFYLTFEDAEAYEIRVHYPTGGDVEVIPFPVVVGRTDDRPLIIGAASVLLGAVAVVALLKRLQRARGRPRRKAAVAAR